MMPSPEKLAALVDRVEAREIAENGRLMRHPRPIRRRFLAEAVMELLRNDRDGARTLNPVPAPA